MRATLAFDGLNNFLDTCKRILDIRAQGKQMYKRTRLRNKFLKDKSDENKQKYSKQRNYCVPLLRKSKSDYFGNLNEESINESKTFWKTIKCFLSNKVTLTNKMTLIDKEEIIMGDYNTAKVTHFLEYFLSNIVSNLYHRIFEL